MERQEHCDRTDLTPLLMSARMNTSWWIRSPTEPKEASVLKSRLISGALVLSLGMVACSVDNPSGEGAKIVESESSSDEGTDTSGSSEANDTAEQTPVGTRDNPVQVGTTVDLGDWQVAVVDVTKDASDQVAEENSFNDPPVDGRQFLLWAAEATYTGDESGTAWVDLSWGVVGTDGNTFGTGSDDYCGVIPDDITDAGETFPGGMVAGNLCVSVPSDQIDGGTIRVEDSFSFDTNRVFFAIP